MSQVENHMVVGPDSFDKVVECKHKNWSIEDVSTHGDDWVQFDIRCDECDETGYINADINHWHSKDWDDAS